MPFGKLTQQTGQSPSIIGKSTINGGFFFNSHVKFAEGIRTIIHVICIVYHHIHVSLGRSFSVFPTRHKADWWFQQVSAIYLLSSKLHRPWVSTKSWLCAGSIYVYLTRGYLFATISVLGHTWLEWFETNNHKPGFDLWKLGLAWYLPI